MSKKKMINEILNKPTINADEFRTVLGVSRGTFSTLKKEQRIPKPISLGPRSNRWSSKLVRDFIDGGAA